MIEHRRKLLGRPAAKGYALRGAENALDLMLTRQWLTRPLYEGAAALRRLYLAAFPALPTVKTVNIAETPGEATVGRLQRMFHEPNPDGDAAAMTRLRAIWRVLDLRPRARDELLELCLLSHSWPTWLLAMIEGRELIQPERRARAAFFEGLHLVNRVLAHRSLQIA